ncbi:MAG: hypothetical protein ABFD03_01805, partial [Clostridiaceae bacterium]
FVALFILLFVFTSQNYWLVFCFLHYIVFKVPSASGARFRSRFLPAFPLPFLSRDSFYSIAIGGWNVNLFFDVFLKSFCCSLEKSDEFLIHLPALFERVPDYSTSCETKKQALFLRFSNFFP